MEKFLELPIIRLIHRLGYPLKITLGVILLAMGLGIAILSMLMSQQRLMSLIEKEKNDNQLEKNLRKLSEHILRHHLFLKKYQSGDKQLRNDILQLQMSVLSDFQTLEQKLNSTENFYIESSYIREILENWQSLIKNSTEKNDQIPEGLYELILQRLNTWIILLGNQIRIHEKELPFERNFQNVSKIEIPFHVILINAALASPKTSNRAVFEKAFKKSNDLTQQGIKLYNESENGFKLDLIPLQESLRSYNIAGEEFLNYTNLQETESWKQEEALFSLERVIASLYVFWDTLSQVNDQIFQEQIEKFTFYRTFLLPVILISSIFGFLLLLIVALEFYYPIRHMFQGIERFYKGDLNCRSLIYYEDRVGYIAHLLNNLGDSFEQIIRQLQRTGTQLSTSTTEIAAAAKQQEITVVEQEATTKEIAVTAGEISATAKEFAKTMNSISETAEQTSNLATTGKDGLTQMELIMRHMVEASASIASRLGVLNEKALAITTVVTTIAKVADQTNLLSLNASIEAEKAGEMGRSFAVIAREIRRLADQTASATLDIEKMVNEMVSAVSAAVMGVDKFTEEIRTGVGQVSHIGEVLSQIIEQVQGLTTSFENVNQGMRNQTVGAEQITEAINQLSEVAQQTSTSIRQFQNAIEQVNVAARDMQASAAKIKHN